MTFLIIIGQCAEAVTGGSASSPKSCDLLVSITALASVMVMSFLSMSSLLVSSREDDNDARCLVKEDKSIESSSASAASCRSVYSSSSSSSSFAVFDRITLR